MIVESNHIFKFSSFFSDNLYKLLSMGVIIQVFNYIENHLEGIENLNYLQVIKKIIGYINKLLAN